MEALKDANVLIKSFNKCKNGSIWKESVQKYEINLLKNTYNQIKSIKNQTYKHKPFNEFTLNERGKTRDIKAIHISDRVILRALCDEILTPRLNKYLIYDNGASVKGKGIDFTRKRFETHLHKFYRQYKTNEGYILTIDFSKFFDNVQHNKLMNLFKYYLQDEELLNFLEDLIQCFQIDVSYLTNDDYQNCLNILFNSIQYSKIHKSLLTGEKFMNKSIGIGSQLSQISGLLYPIEIDNYCKIVKGLKYYGRYMDDIYIIHPDKQFLQQLLKEIDNICQKYGIFINYKKTQIIKLTKTLIFLKTRYNLTKTGKIIKRMSKDSIVRERKKLKKYKNLLDQGKMTYKDIEEAYGSWRGNLKNYLSYHTKQNMDKLYDDLFIKSMLEKE